jgi:hypothetical protein
MGGSCSCTYAGEDKEGRPIYLVDPDCPVHGNPEDR